MMFDDNTDEQKAPETTEEATPEVKPEAQA
jgi:hypothetical protein